MSPNSIQQSKQQLHHQAIQAINQKRYDIAQQALIRLLNRDPKFADGYFLLGIIEADLGTFTKATALINKASLLDPKAEYFAHLAKCHAMIGDSVKTYDAIRQAEQGSINDALTMDTLGVALSRLGDHDKAIDYFKQAIGQKSQASFYYNLGSSQTFAGDFAGARVSYEKAIELEPLFYQAHSSLSHLGGVSLEHNHVDRLEAVLPKMPNTNAKLHICHALARELDALGEYERGFTYLQRAKAEKRSQQPYNFAQDKAIFDSLYKGFNSSTVAKIKQANHAKINSGIGDDAVPIFVTGMPRSGTTLIERVLTNHDEVVSAGELQEMAIAIKQVSQTQSQYILDPQTIKGALEKPLDMIGQQYLRSLPYITEGATYFVDKMPLNVLNAGFIIGALPKAKVICVIRNPMDTIWGNFKQLFSLTDSYYNYAFSQVDTAKYYCEFVRLAEYWQAAFPEQFKVIYYDEFVQAPEKYGKDFVDFCGLEYNPAMLDITANRSAVATASSVQVRSAINTKSLGQWRRYQAWLAEAEKEVIAQGFKVV